MRRPRGPSLGVEVAAAEDPPPSIFFACGEGVGRGTINSTLRSSFQGGGQKNDTHLFPSLPSQRPRRPSSRRRDRARRRRPPPSIVLPCGGDGGGLQRTINNWSAGSQGGGKEWRRTSLSRRHRAARRLSAPRRPACRRHRPSSLPLCPSPRRAHSPRPLAPSPRLAPPLRSPYPPQRHRRLHRSRRRPPILRGSRRSR